MFKFLQGVILAFALIALVGISQKAHAQYSLHPVTVDVTPQEFQAVYAFGVIPIFAGYGYTLYRQRPRWRYSALATNRTGRASLSRCRRHDT